MSRLIEPMREIVRQHGPYRLARLAGVEPGVLYQFVAGKRLVSSRVMEKLASAVGLRLQADAPAERPSTSHEPAPEPEPEPVPEPRTKHHDIADAVRASKRKMADIAHEAGVDRANLSRYVGSPGKGLGAGAILRLMEALGMFDTTPTPLTTPLETESIAPKPAVQPPPRPEPKASVPEKAPSVPATPLPRPERRLDPRAARKLA